MRSDRIAPRRPKSAPEAPTETPFLMKRTESTLPPKPETRYTSPTFPAGGRTATNAGQKTASVCVAAEEPCLSVLGRASERGVRCLGAYRIQTAAPGGRR